MFLSLIILSLSLCSHVNNTVRKHEIQITLKLHFSFVFTVLFYSVVVLPFLLMTICVCQITFCLTDHHIVTVSQEQSPNLEIIMSMIWIKILPWFTINLLFSLSVSQYGISVKSVKNTLFSEHTRIPCQGLANGTLAQFQLHLTHSLDL